MPLTMQLSHPNYKVLETFRIRKESNLDTQRIRLGYKLRDVSDPNQSDQIDIAAENHNPN